MNPNQRRASGIRKQRASAASVGGVRKPSGRDGVLVDPPLGVGVPTPATGPGVSVSLGDGLGLGDGVGVGVAGGVGVALAMAVGVAVGRLVGVAVGVGVPVCDNGDAQPVVVRLEPADRRGAQHARSQQRTAEERNAVQLVDPVQRYPEADRRDQNEPRDEVGVTDR